MKICFASAVSNNGYTPQPMDLPIPLASFGSRGPGEAPASCTCPRWVCIQKTVVSDSPERMCSPRPVDSRRYSAARMPMTPYEAGRISTFDALARACSAGEQVPDLVEGGPRCGGPLEEALD